MSDFTVVDPDPGLSRLQGDESARRLEQLANLSAKRIGDHVSLPQIAVCGDQSTGKSSVLEGLTGIPFPRQDGLCTRFATEIIIQHNSQDSFDIEASIIPHHAHPKALQDTLSRYRKHLHSFQELPSVITEVGGLMGIRGFGENAQGPAFSFDTLRIRVNGPTQMHLSVVDLPGLISVSDDAENDSDVDIVHQLVESYLANERTIVLAIVQAGNDTANQPILKMTRKFDKHGKRTIGVITKADLININTERKVVMLAQNQDSIKLNHGWFLLKNPTPEDIANEMTFDQRVNMEQSYFQKPRWKDAGLDMRCVGIMALRLYVQGVLDKHIKNELPKVVREIRKLYRKREVELQNFGPERQNPASMRSYLTSLSMAFHRLLSAGSFGTYLEVDPSFFALTEDNEGPALRLRAAVHMHNAQFSEYMREKGCKRKMHHQDEGQDEVSEDGDRDVEADILMVTKADMRAWVKKVYRNTRGQELPGSYSHTLLAELFRQQCSRWKDIAEDHVRRIHEVVENFVDKILVHVVHDETTLSELRSELERPLEGCHAAAKAELERLWDDEQAVPLTYNHYYTDNIQKSRNTSLEKTLRAAMDKVEKEDYRGRLHVSNNQVDARAFLHCLQSRVVVDMDDQACTEALAALDAYYKVARKTWVDNVCRQVVERHIIRKLPDLFNPPYVAALPDESLQRLAGERSDRARQRKELVALLGDLQSALKDLK